MEYLYSPSIEEVEPSALTLTDLISYMEGISEPIQAFVFSFSTVWEGAEPNDFHPEALWLSDSHKIVIAFPSTWELHFWDSGEQVDLPDTLTTLEPYTTDREIDPGKLVLYALEEFLEPYGELGWRDDSDGPAACPFCRTRLQDINMEPCEHFFGWTVDRVLNVITPRDYGEAIPFDDDVFPYYSNDLGQTWTAKQLADAFGPVLALVMSAYIDEELTDSSVDDAASTVTLSYPKSSDVFYALVEFLPDVKEVSFGVRNGGMAAASYSNYYCDHGEYENAQSRIKAIFADLERGFRHLEAIQSADVSKDSSNDPAYRKAVKRIKAAQQSRATYLNLADIRLRQLPDSIGQLTDLQVLFLQGNQLTTLPESLGQLTQLQQLNLYNNQFITLPDWLGQLTNLRFLSLHNNQLNSLPESSGQLIQLVALDLASNQLTTLPESLGQLTQLQRLYLAENQLTNLPVSLGQLTQLYELNLYRNPLNPELAAVYAAGLPSVMKYLQAKASQEEPS